MKKIVLGVMVALMALSLATSVSADNGRSRGRGEGLWKRWGNFQRKWDKKNDDRSDRGNKFGLFGDCGKNARNALHEDMKEAFSAFMEAKSAAKDERDQAIEDADGDATKISAAWTEYGKDIQAAWLAYTTKTIAALGIFKADFAGCPVVVNTPAPKTTPLPEYTLDTVSTHDQLNDCWIAVDEKVYNITNLVDTYDDGEEVFDGMCGKDASDAIEDLEDEDDDIFDTLKKYKIGVLK